MLDAVFGKCQQVSRGLGNADAIKSTGCHLRQQELVLTKFFVEEFQLEIKELQTILDIEATGGSQVPYHGYVESILEIPMIEKFDINVLMLVVNEVRDMSEGKGCISLVLLPKLDELYVKLQGYKVLRTLDLWSGYYHIGLSDSAKPKTAFVISGMGKFKLNRVPFSLVQAPAYFQRLINELLTDCNFAMGYLDDIIIFSKTEEEHLQHLEEIFEQL